MLSAAIGRFGLETLSQDFASAETRFKMRESALGRSLSEETKAKISMNSKAGWSRKQSNQYAPLSSALILTTFFHAELIFISVSILRMPT